MLPSGLANGPVSIPPKSDGTQKGQWTATNTAQCRPIPPIPHSQGRHLSKPINAIPECGRGIYSAHACLAFRLVFKTSHVGTGLFFFERVDLTVILQLDSNLPDQKPTLQPPSRNREQTTRYSTWSLPSYRMRVPIMRLKRKPHIVLPFSAFTYFTLLVRKLTKAMQPSL